jgi:hypothetical protein
MVLLRVVLRLLLLPLLLLTWGLRRDRLPLLQQHLPRALVPGQQSGGALAGPCGRLRPQVERYEAHDDARQAARNIHPACGIQPLCPHHTAAAPHEGPVGTVQQLPYTHKTRRGRSTQAA